MSPSLSNVQSLQTKFKNQKIVLAHRPLPWVNPEPEQLFHDKDFVLVFERNCQDMKQLLRVWSETMPKLVIVGARGRYPHFVIPLNEYYPYKKLLYLMKKARFIVDLSEICDYHSSILDLANAMGKTMLSTNWYVLNKPNGSFVVRTEHENGGRFIPNDDVLKKGIERALSIPCGKIQDMSNYNSTFINQIRLLFA